MNHLHAMIQAQLGKEDARLWLQNMPTRKSKAIFQATN
jgi:hypothetical protein